MIIESFISKNAVAALSFSRDLICIRVKCYGRIKKSFLLFSELMVRKSTV